MIGTFEILEDGTFVVNCNDTRYIIPKHIGKLVRIIHLHRDIEFELCSGQALPDTKYLYIENRGGMN
jgi:hypothetical protein